MRSRIPLLALLAAVLALPATAGAEPALDGEFPVDDKPGQLVQGPDGNVWFLVGTQFGRITPDGTVSDDFGLGMAAPKGITADATRLWISANGQVFEVDPLDPENPVAHPVAEIGSARGIAVEPADGDVWVVDDSDGKVVEIEDDDGTFKREIPGDPVNATTPSGRGITVGSDGKLWWADANGPSVQATDPATATSEGYEVSGGQVQEIAAGPAGQLAFASPADLVGRIATDGTVQPTPNPMRDAFGVTFANDQAYWFAEFASDTLGRLTPDGELTHPIDLPADADPRYITTGADDTLWVSLEDLTNMTNPRIARITGVSAPPPDPGPDPGGDPGPGTGPGGGPDTGGTGAGIDTVDPGVGPLSIRPKAFRVGRDATIRFTLTEDATVIFRVQRVRKGRRRADGKCVKRRRGPRCTRLGRVRRFTTTVQAGATAVEFDGRVAGRRLKRGAYRLTVVARDAAGNESTPRRVRFRIKKRRRAGAG